MHFICKTTKRARCRKGGEGTIPKVRTIWLSVFRKKNPLGYALFTKDSKEKTKEKKIQEKNRWNAREMEREEWKSKWKGKGNWHSNSGMLTFYRSPSLCVVSNRLMTQWKPQQQQQQLQCQNISKTTRSKKDKHESSIINNCIEGGGVRRAFKSNYDDSNLTDCRLTINQSQVKARDRDVPTIQL